MRAERATLDWPAEDRFESEEQDEPLAGQDRRDTIDSLSYPLRGRLASPDGYVAAELRRAAQEQARLAEERAAQWQARAEREAAARQVLEEELTRLRGRGE